MLIICRLAALIVYMKKVALPLLFAVSSVFPSVIFGQDNDKLIKDYISQNKLREYKKSDLAGFIIDNVDNSNSLGGNVVKFQQTYHGHPVYNAGGTALVKDNKIVYYTDNFVKDYTSAASAAVLVNKTAALQKIAQNLQKQVLENYPVLSFTDADPLDGKFVKQRLVYTENAGNLKLAHEFSFPEPGSSSYWNILVDASNGEIISKQDLNLSCNFHQDAYSHDHSHAHNEFIGPLNKNSQAAAYFLAPDNASYNVFPLPIESATFGSRSIVNNPWILTASPEGWHYDGTTRYTTTRGNNVYAYEDTSALNSPGLSPDAGASRNFDYPFSINADQYANQNASITNLFYINNKVHDIFYTFGFTPAAKNFQNNNFGQGGTGNDYVLAEAQDGGGTNNANFSTPTEGSRPRMQMFMWSPVNRLFFYNSPSAAVPRQPVAGTAQFGNPLDAAGVTGNVQLSSVLDGCTAIPAGSLAGKIGLIERGTCAFTVKVKNAQNAGANAVIIYNNVAGAVGGMSGTDATITIPSVFITNTEGAYIKGLLASNTTVNVTLKDDPATNVTPDGSFDNGIVAHEYGHGISTRLTGTNVGCLNSSVDKEQMGEGWSDFFALMLTNKPGDNAAVPRGIGTYAVGQATDGLGIRPARYSPDFAVNDYTYVDTNGMEYTNSNGQIVPDVHSIGFVWATALWDLHWQYAAKYGYASDVTANPNSGSARVLRLVTDALKLQPCYPSFTEGRDAILAAEQATTQGADRCMIWRTFAKRGIGVNASAGSKSNINDQVQDLSVPSDCVLATEEVSNVKNNTISIYPNPAKNEFFINFPTKTLGKVSVEIYDMSGKLVSSEDKISPDMKKAIATDKLVNGTYMVKVKGIGIDTASKLLINK